MTGIRRGLVHVGAGVFAAAVVVVLVWIRHRSNGGWMMDLEVYRMAGRAIVDGEALYSGFVLPESGIKLAYVYPPVAAVLFVPVALAGISLASLVVMVVSIACLSGIVIFSWRESGAQIRWWVTGGLIVAVSLLDPVQITLFLGQINLIIIFLIVADATFLKRTRFMGVGTGVAVAVKLTAGLIVVYFLATRQFRAALVATGSFLAATVVGWCFTPKGSVDYWLGGKFFDVARFDVPEDIHNQSLLGVVLRTLGGSLPASLVWLVLALSACVLGLVLAISARRAVGELCGVVICGASTLLASPISWGHHWVWVAPAVVVLGGRALVGRSAPLFVATLGAFGFFLLRPYEWGISVDPSEAMELGFWAELQAASYPMATVIVLVGAAYVLDRRSRVMASSFE